MPNCPTEHAGGELVVFEQGKYCLDENLLQASKYSMSGPFQIASDSYTTAERPSVFVALSKEDLKRLDELEPRPV